MDENKLKSILESLLFVSGEPLSISKIARVAGVKDLEVERAVQLLQDDYEKGRGLAIVRKENNLQMTTRAENAEAVSALVKSEIQENLSRAALEVLAIIAYRGPISRSHVESIRGVNCSFTIRTLLMRGLLERVDNPADSRAYLYKISFDFLKKLGVTKIEELPDFENLSKDPRIESVLNP